MGEVLGSFDWIVALAIGFIAAWLIQQFRLQNSGAESPEVLEERNRLHSEEAEAIARLEERSRGLGESLVQARSFRCRRPVRRRC